MPVRYQLKKSKQLKLKERTTFPWRVPISIASWRASLLWLCKNSISFKIAICIPNHIGDKYAQCQREQYAKEYFQQTRGARNSQVYFFVVKTIKADNSKYAQFWLLNCPGRKGELTHEHIKHTKGTLLSGPGYAKTL